MLIYHYREWCYVITKFSWGGGEDRLDAYIFRVEAFKNKVHPRTGPEGPEGE